MKVSVITPCLNHGRFLEQLIRSVEMQGYQNIEHIVVDGGSTDNSLQVLQKHPKVKWVTGVDTGFADAVNHGFQLASGGLLTVQNADDYYSSRCSFQYAVEAYEKLGNGVVYGGEVMVDETGKMLDTFVPCSFSYIDLLLSREVIPQCSAFFTREVVDEIGGFDTRCDYYSDCEFFLRAGLHYQIGFFPYLVSCYRVYRNQRSSLVDNHLGKRHAMITRFFKEQKLPVDLKKLYRKAVAGAFDWDARKSNVRTQAVKGWLRSFIHDPQVHPIRKIGSTMIH